MCVGIPAKPSIISQKYSAFSGNSMWEMLLLPKRAMKLPCLRTYTSLYVSKSNSFISFVTVVTDPFSNRNSSTNPASALSHSENWTLEEKMWPWLPSFTVSEQKSIESIVSWFENTSCSELGQFPKQRMLYGGPVRTKSPVPCHETPCTRNVKFPNF